METNNHFVKYLMEFRLLKDWIVIGDCLIINRNEIEMVHWPVSLKLKINYFTFKESV